MEFASQLECDEYWMKQALAQAELAEQAGEVPVGAVLVSNNELLAVGANQPIASHDPTAHAEIRVLRSACEKLGNYRLPADACLYVTLEPCPMCAGALVHGRVSRVVFGATDPRTGAAGTIINILQHESLNHRADISGGVLATECAAILQNFFRSRR